MVQAEEEAVRSATTAFRRTRTVIVASAIVTLAAGAHLLGGGSLPNVGVLMGLAAPSRSATDSAGPSAN